MFTNLSSGFNAKKRALLEKAGKVKPHEEGAEFDAKVLSLSATHRAFVNLKKVGRSIFDNKGRTRKVDPDAATNPADLFLTDITAVLTLKKKYDNRRIEWESAKQMAFSAAEAAKTPGKNQDKKDKVAENLKKDETTKHELYEAAKKLLSEGIDELEKRRDDEFQKTVTAMCTILTDLQPDWKQVDASGNNGGEFAPPSNASPDEEKDNGGEPDVDSTAPVGEAVGGGSPAPVRAATDSESD